MRRFPLGLTISAVVAFAILMGLGFWQLQRLAWKQDLLARIEALRTAPPRPLGELLTLASNGGDVEYRRAAVRCSPTSAPSRDAYRYAVPDGEVGWRLISVCAFTEHAYDGIMVDRGVVRRLTGAMAPTTAAYAAPGDIVGVLRRPGAKPMLGPAETSRADASRVFRVLDQAAVASLARDSGLRRPAPYILAVESETPGAAGVAPAALPQDIPNNHFAYALTWFALAVVMAWIYAAMLLRRLRGR